MKIFPMALALASTSLFAGTPATTSVQTPVAAARNVPAPLKPFEEVVRGAQESRGLLTLWQKDGKVWLEVKPGQIGPLFFLSWTYPRGLGERGFYGGMMGDSHLVHFRRVGDTLQLLARNTAFMAQAGAPIAHAVSEGFSDSLLASAPVASLPGGRDKGFLVDASALFIRDIPMASLDLEYAFRQPYAFDAPNSSFRRAASWPDRTVLDVDAHFSLPRPSFATAAFLPETLEDVRSLFLGFQYAFVKLPDTPMAPRPADDRVGHFVSTRWDFSNDLEADPRIRLVNRWRLEKADPGAALSRPKEPIVVRLDRNIPKIYRPAVEAGILEWNKAFERIGFKDAIKVVQQPDGEEREAPGIRHASIRWFLGVDAGFAIGPSLVDPRSGEILQADIAVGELFTRVLRDQHRQEVATPPRARTCSLLAEGREETAFGLDLLEARGSFEPGSQEELKFVQDELKAVVMHEAGHIWGLRHNFRASTAYTEAQLCDKAFTATHGIAGSVMDYTPVNLAGPGQAQAGYVMPTLGPYDYWAIEYAYKELDPRTEKADLQRIAARGETDPLLAYAPDEEAGPGPDAMDPEVNRFDLGRDPLLYLEKRFALSRELLDRLQARAEKPGEDYCQLRRSTGYALDQMAFAASNAAKYLGGVVCLRDHAGSHRMPLTPVTAARQRHALDLITSGIFRMDALRLDPGFVAKLASDPFDRGLGRTAPDFSVTDHALTIQKAVLARLLDPKAMDRILDAPEKTSEKDTFRLSELFDGLHRAIWKEAIDGVEPTVTRRGLQTEHLRRLTDLLLRRDPRIPDDARALAREDLARLDTQLRRAAGRSALSRETRAHFRACRSDIEEVLKARLDRNGI